VRRRRDTGVAMAHTKEQGAYAIHPDDYLKLKEAWMAGRAFVELRAYHGAEQIIKLGTIEAIQMWTPEALAAERDETVANKAEDTITGAE
jgi:hypothetical protein